MLISPLLSVVLDAHFVRIEQGACSVAIAYALLESGVLGGPVSIAEAEAEHFHTYQRSIDQAMGLA